MHCKQLYFIILRRAIGSLGASRRARLRQMAPPPAARRRRLSDSDLTCATTKRRFAALDIYAKATATSAGRSRHELVRLGELKPARRHSFDWLQFCRDGDRRPVARPPLTLFHELRCFYDPEYRPGQDKSDSTSLRRECSARARSGKSIHASRPFREMIARPKISRNEWKTAEI